MGSEMCIRDSSLDQALTSRDAFVRLAAARAAGLIGRDDVVPALENLLKDPSQAIRAEAAWSLGLLGDPQALLCWVVADNVLKGAAWNAVQIAARVAGKDIA